jgi:hypothetical protein
MPLLHPQAQIAEEPQDSLGVCAPAEMMPQVEEQIDFVPAHATAGREELVDHFDGATPAAERRLAFREDGG